MNNYVNYKYIFKILLVGDSGIGKSSIISRFSDSYYSDDILSTIGVDFKIKSIIVNDIPVKLQIWDTAGHERFRSITKSYYRGSNGVIIAFDLSNESSFEHVINWMNDIDNYCEQYTYKILVGTKSDVTIRPPDIYDKINEFTEKYDIKYIETSAKDDKNIKILFDTLVQNIFMERDRRTIEYKPILLSPDNNTKIKKSCC